MSGIKRLLMILLVLVLLGAVAAGIYWNREKYVLVDFRFYPKNTRQLDLRGKDISVKHYEKLHRRIPDCEIVWDVPFQDKLLPYDTEEITVYILSEEDVQALECFPKLKTLKAESCGDYDNLLAFSRSRPDVQVNYAVKLGKDRFSGRAKQISLDTVTQEDIARLVYLPNLQKVLCGGGEAEDIAALQGYCLENDLEFMVTLGGEAVPENARNVEAEAITDAQLGLLEFLPAMKTLHIQEPEVSADDLLALQEARPDVSITWEQELYGTVYDSDEEEIDLSGVEITSLEELDQNMEYFPDVKTVFLGECGLDNEVLAAQREKVRDKYKLVWTVSCGSKLKTRTDALTFMPVREYVYYFNDEEAYNLRYCEDMVCIDIGHMSIHNIDFVEFMPNLEYLILAHTQLQYIEPIRHCKKLKFLELDWSPIRDLSPLKECTALEDLNLGNTFADFAPVAEMTWLKNLWMIDCSTRARYEMTEALPNTKVMVTGAATVANGWRNLDNYYEMRDLLGMHYMSW